MCVREVKTTNTNNLNYSVIRKQMTKKGVITNLDISVSFGVGDGEQGEVIS